MNTLGKTVKKPTVDTPHFKIELDKLEHRHMIYFKH